MCYICILTDRPDPVQRHRAWPHQPAVSGHVVVDTFKRTCVIFVSSQTDPNQYRDIVPGLTNLLSQIMCYICIITDRPDPVQRHRAWPHQPAVSDHVLYLYSHRQTRPSTGPSCLASPTCCLRSCRSGYL